MEINDKLQKEITETAYLNQENTFRYRPIMRFFYQTIFKMRSGE